MSEAASYWAEHAWLGGERVESGVGLRVEDGRFAAVEPGRAGPEPGAVRLGGLVIPGLANTHSHAFHRGLRGRSQRGRGSFWTWREGMYRLADRLDPDSYLRLARATFGEMALAGIVAVGEFHYLHHDHGGTPYADPNELGRVLARAAAEAGIRITLLDACYLRGGPGVELEPTQLRFSDGDVERWAARAEAIGDLGEHGRIGAAIHSVRAVDRRAAAEVAAWAERRQTPLHAHVSEQPAENEACRAETGLTPTGVLAEAGALSERFSAVHFTHVTGEDVALMGRHRCHCCLCPTTERDLADGVGRAEEFLAVGCRLTLGSDSHAVIDHFEEMRAVELDQRLTTGERGIHPPGRLLEAATAEGHGSIGWDDAGRIEPGARADLVAISLDSPRMAGLDPDDLLAGAVFAAAPDDVREVIVDGRRVVGEGRHLTVDVAAELDESIGGLWT